MSEPDRNPERPTPHDDEDSVGKQKSPRRKPPRRRGRLPEQSFERIAEVHYCRTDEEANQYLALGPEWDLQDIIPMRVETEDGERDEVHFVVARWENERDRARIRARDRRGVFPPRDE